MWDLTQWSYLTSVIVGAYFLGLTWVWLKEKKYKADPFFYYVIFLVLTTVVSRASRGIARHYFLMGDPSMRDVFITSWLWFLINLVPILILSVMSIHATYRFMRRR